MQNTEKIQNMAQLVGFLNYATDQYEKGNPIVSDQEWDDKYFELLKIERETGSYLSNSPTRNIHYTLINQLNKVKHNHLMLSLDKTKELDDVKKFINNNAFIAMSKIDGLTCSLCYKNGYLVSAETRGDGEIGEDILHNALTLPSIPRRISYTDELIIDGEVICALNDFKEFEEEYKNPRNFAAGSIRLLDANECAKRKLTFIAWDVIKGFENITLLSEKLSSLISLGFITVPIIKSDEISESLIDSIKTISYRRNIPIDGAVFKFDNIAFGKAQGATNHHFKNAIAYKFYDDVYLTELTGIEWTMGRTGILTPVATFKPVDIEGSEVERANLHNLTVLENTLQVPWVGQSILVYKANMIIPQISGADKETEPPEDKILHNPETCPVCGSALEVIGENNSFFLRCSNPKCEGKLLNQLDHFCGKKGLDIKGLSLATLAKLINLGWINNKIDVFFLVNHADEWEKISGFGKRSVEKILAAIEDSKNTTLDAFIAAIGIPLIGNAVAKDLVKTFKTYNEFRNAIKSKFDFTTLDGFAENKAASLLLYDYTEADEIYKLLNIAPITETNDELKLMNKKFVITGSIKMYKNRNELKSFIERQGGKVLTTMSRQVDYLINNDVNSKSNKNVMAKQLGIPIISEMDLMKILFDN